MNANAPPFGTGKRGRTLDALLHALQVLLLERGAGELKISDVCERAGVVQGTFYNYAQNLDQLVDLLAQLLAAAHAAQTQFAPSSKTDPVAAFVFKTRRTLSLAASERSYGRLLFDSGLPVDRLLGAMRRDLEVDIRNGVRLGAFSTSDADLSASIIAGVLLGVGLDLRRGKLKKAAIEKTTTQLLILLGVSPGAAHRAATARVTFPPPPALPLRWLSLAASERSPQ